MTVSQKTTFLQGEADRYFERNRKLYEAAEPNNTVPLDFFSRFIKSGGVFIPPGLIGG